MGTKLTTDLLYKLGFHGQGKGITNRPTFRLDVPYNSKNFENGYAFIIQIELGDYPETNPNSGILSIHMEAEKDQHVWMDEDDDGSKESKKIDFIEWREDGKRGGIKYMDMEEMTQPIAWHVTTLERLNAIYTALTMNPPLEPRKTL